jgi:cobalt/nickel transport system permease protein
MAHIHLEDGSFTLFWVVVWWLIALLIVGGALWYLRRRAHKDPAKITIAAFVTAAAFVVFQINIPLFGGVHLSLTPLIGILTGPVIGPLVVLVVNILSAAIGHGGWGLIGANVLVNLSEVLVAYLAFRGLARIIPDLFARAGIATFAGLFCGNCVMILIILISGIQGATGTQAQMLTGLSLIAAVNMGMAAIEAVLTGMVVRYIGKIRPDLLGVSPHE